MKKKMLKIKVGEIYKNGETHSVYNTAWEQVSKDGKTRYFEMKTPIFVQEIEVSDKPADASGTEQPFL